jgi:HK97 family phage major capsid protein
MSAGAAARKHTGTAGQEKPMPRKSIELKDEKGRLTTEYRAELERAGGKVTAANKDALAKMDTRLDELEFEIPMNEKQEAREASMAGGSDPGARKNPTDPQNEADPKAKKFSGGIRSTKPYDDAVNKYLRTGSLSGITPELRNAMGSIRNETLEADDDELGGFITVSEQLADRMIEAMDNQTFFRSSLGCTKTILTTAQSLGIPVRTGDVDDINWTTELAIGAVDTGLKFGKRELHPHPLAKKVLISKKLMRLTPMIQAKVIQRLGYKFGTTNEVAFLLGTGVQQPLGVFTPSADGISTTQDVVTGSTTGFIATSAGVNGSDCLFDCLYNLKAQYQARASWIFHRSIVKLIRKMKDLEGRYIWQPGLQPGQPATILDRPFYMSEYAPSTLTTGQYIGIVGDFSHYEIVDALDMEIQRLDELYAESNSVGFIARAETDGAPVLQEAFTRLCLS